MNYIEQESLKNKLKLNDYHLLLQKYLLFIIKKNIK